MYIFSISFSSHSFDMLVKLLLEFLFNLSFWTYLSFALFTMCLVHLLSSQTNAALDSSLDFWFQIICSNSKKKDDPCPVSSCLSKSSKIQVIWRIELLVYHKESSWIGNNTTCSDSCSSWMKDSERHQRIESEAWARLWHSHYHYNHEGGVNAGQVEGGTCRQWRSWKI